VDDAVFDFEKENNVQKIIIKLPANEWESFLRHAYNKNISAPIEAGLIFREALIERGIIKDSRRQFPRRLRRAIVIRRKVAAE